MDFSLTESERDLVALCREFAQKEIAPRAPKAWDDAVMKNRARNRNVLIGMNFRAFMEEGRRQPVTNDAEPDPSTTQSNGQRLLHSSRDKAVGGSEKKEFHCVRLTHNSLGP